MLAGRIVDNSSPAAVDVQVTRAGAGDRIDTDAVVFTYSQTMLPASILTGWNGASTAITVRVTDNGTTDHMDFYNAADTTRLNLTGSASGLQLNGNHVAAAGTACLPITVTESGTADEDF